MRSPCRSCCLCALASTLLCGPVAMRAGAGKSQLAQALLSDHSWPLVDPISGATRRVSVLRVRPLSR